MTTTRLIRLRQVRELTGLGPTSIFELERRERFPRRLRLAGTRSVAWVAAEIEEWCAARVRERDALRSSTRQTTAP